MFSSNAGAGDAVTFALVLLTLAILFRPSARLRQRISAGREYAPVPAADNPPVRRAIVAAAIGLGIMFPLTFSGYYQSLAAYALIVGLIVLSLVVLTGLVGQISFCQYSFAAIGAFTVGSLVGGHHWSFWPALLLGVAFAVVVGMLVGIPALRLSGLFLAILTVAVALFFDHFLLAPGTWDSLLGRHLLLECGTPELPRGLARRAYAFYLFTLGVFLSRRPGGLEPQPVEDRPRAARDPQLRDCGGDERREPHRVEAHGVRCVGRARGPGGRPARGRDRLGERRSVHVPAVARRRGDRDRGRRPLGRRGGGRRDLPDLRAGAADPHTALDTLVPADRRRDPDRPGDPHAARRRRRLAGAVPEALPAAAAVPRGAGRPDPGRIGRGDRSEAAEVAKV